MRASGKLRISPSVVALPATVSAALTLLIASSGCGNSYQRSFPVAPEPPISPTPGRTTPPATPDSRSRPTPSPQQIDPLELGQLPLGIEGEIDGPEGKILVQAATAERVAQCQRLSPSALRASAPCAHAQLVLPYQVDASDTAFSRTEDPGALRTLFQNVTYRIPLALPRTRDLNAFTRTKQFLATRWNLPADKIALSLAELSSAASTSLISTVQIAGVGASTTLSTIATELAPVVSIARILPGSEFGVGSSKVLATIGGPRLEVDRVIPQLLSGSAGLGRARILQSQPVRIPLGAAPSQVRCDLAAISVDVRQALESLRRTHFRRGLLSESSCQAMVQMGLGSQLDPQRPTTAPLSCSNRGASGDFSDFGNSFIEAQWASATEEEFLLFQTLGATSTRWCDSADPFLRRVAVSEALRLVLVPRRIFAERELMLWSRAYARQSPSTPAQQRLPEPGKIGLYQPLPISTDAQLRLVRFKLTPQSGAALVDILPSKRFVIASSVPVEFSLQAAPLPQWEEQDAQARTQMLALHQVHASRSCDVHQSQTPDHRCIDVCAEGQTYIPDHGRAGTMTLVPPPHARETQPACYPTLTAFEDYGHLQVYRAGTLLQPDQDPVRNSAVFSFLERWTRRVPGIGIGAGAGGAHDLDMLDDLSSYLLGNTFGSSVSGNYSYPTTH